MEVLHMKKTLTISGKTRTLLFIIAGVLAAGILLVSCGGGGYGGGGGGYGMGMVLPPAMFSLTSPTDGATSVSTTPNLMWSTSLYATGYYVYLKKDTDTNFTLITSTMATSFMISSALASTTLYDWKVTAHNSSGMVTSATFTFTTM
jgi:beta-glucosidase